MTWRTRKTDARPRPPTGARRPRLGVRRRRAFSQCCRDRHAVVNALSYRQGVKTKLSDAFLTLLSMLLMMLSTWLSLR